MKRAAGVSNKVDSEIADNSAERIFKLFTLQNSKGTKLIVSNYGAAVVSLFVKDKYGNFSDVVLGYDHPEDYFEDEYYLGTVVGRYANRIGSDTVIINKLPYKISARAGGYHLHGGECGFNKKVFKAQPFNSSAGAGIILDYTSPHLEEGFPGELQLKVRYLLDEDDCWAVEYSAATDKTTIVNLTQHSYFNLSGNGINKIDDHELKIFSNYFLPVNKLQVPTGEIAEVVNTPFDFTSFKRMAQDIEVENEQLKLSSGYDHSYVFKNEKTPFLAKAAIVREPVSGRQMEVYTTEPAIHFYTGNFLKNVKGKRGEVYNRRAGFCLETQHYPDAPNHPNFPSTVLNPGDLLYSKTVYKFTTESSSG